MTLKEVAEHVCSAVGSSLHHLSGSSLESTVENVQEEDGKFYFLANLNGQEVAISIESINGSATEDLR